MTIVISGRNVNDLFPQAIDLLYRDGERNPSRAGEVLSLPHPVVSVTTKPKERVLFDPVRDANPFFHLFESLWMLDGRADAAFLNHFVKDFGDRFAEDNGEIWGAYGARWRNWWGYDQLQMVIDRLKKDPNDRRIVIQMWDANVDLQGLEERPKKDVPCNTQCYVRIVNGALDLSVTVRSNDVVWGAYGANAVHFTILQEYLASMIGVTVGKFYQFSNNWHGYTNVTSKFEGMSTTEYSNPYVVGAVKPQPMITVPEHWDSELHQFLKSPDEFNPIHNMWLFTTTKLAWNAYNLYRDKKYDEAIHVAEGVKASDWSLAMVEWIVRRKKNWEAKNV